MRFSKHTIALRSHKSHAVRPPGFRCIKRSHLSILLVPESPSMTLGDRQAVLEPVHLLSGAIPTEAELASTNQPDCQRCNEDLYDGCNSKPGKDPPHVDSEAIRQL
jgi:hypothetical protein